VTATDKWLDGEHNRRGASAGTSTMTVVLPPPSGACHEPVAGAGAARLAPGQRARGDSMPGQFSGSAVINRPIDEVFAYLAAGTNDPKFSPRVLEIRKEPDGPSRLGTIFVSKVKDAGMKTDRRFELTGFRAPTTIRWTERTKNLVTIPEGGYDLEDLGNSQTKVTIFNSFVGNGFGKVIVGFARKAATKDVDAFAQRIKAAVEAG
jgi:hypothetical protein